MQQSSVGCSIALQDYLYFLAHEYEATKLRWVEGRVAPRLASKYAQKDGCAQRTGAHARPKPTSIVYWLKETVWMDLHQLFTAFFTIFSNWQIFLHTFPVVVDWIQPSGYIVLPSLCRSRNCPGFDLSILRHSGICMRAGRHKKKKI